MSPMALVLSCLRSFSFITMGTILFELEYLKRTTYTSSGPILE
uniref:Uncharacterized protein LOC105120555 n=1 Tax=Rhizophora mucronata TaxID=61149 RepID=A0A2P2P1N3_RHIMU